MIKYKNFLQEALTKELKKEVDTWGDNKAAIKISKHIINPDTGKVTFPLSFKSNQEVLLHPDVIEHLNNHGYKVTNHKKGLVQDPNYTHRQLSIGKVLEKTNASDDIKKKFINGASKQNSKNLFEDLRVTISHHPYDVCAMSTGQGWTSCMDLHKRGNPNFVDNTHFLPKDIKQGTHTAYLHHKDDINLEHPIARINLKPYHSIETSFYQGKHTVLRPEVVSYGTSTPEFEKEVNNWAEENFPAKPDTAYRKDEKLYDDNEEALKPSGAVITGLISKNSKLLKSKNENILYNVAKNTTHQEHLDKLVHDLSPYTLIGVLDNPNVQQHHIDNIKDLDSDNSIIRKKVALQTKNPEHIEEFINSNNYNLYHTILYNPSLTHEHLFTAIKAANNDKYKFDGQIRKIEIFKHPNANDEFHNKILNFNDHNLIKDALANSQNQKFLSNPKFLKIINDTNEFYKDRNRESLEMHPDFEMVHKMATNINMPNHILEKLAKHNHYAISDAAKIQLKRKLSARKLSDILL